MKISFKITSIIGLLFALIAAISLIARYGLTSANDALKTIYEDRVVCLKQLGDIDYMIPRTRTLTMDMIMDPSPENINKRIAEIDSDVREIKKIWSEYKATYLTPDEAKLADAYESTQSKYFTEGLMPTLTAIKAGDLAAAGSIYKKSISPISAQLRIDATNLFQLQLDVAKQEYDSQVDRYGWIKWIAGVLIVGGVAFALAVSVALIRGITRSLQQAIESANSVAKGDLSKSVSISGHDEAGMVLSALVEMKTSLLSVVSQVRDGADSVARASAEISQGNHDLSVRTEQQASALQQTAASMEELNSTVRQNSESAKHADQMAQEARNVAIKGGEVVSQVVGTMKGIQDSSQRIYEIISVIDGIAFQTNILALNAAVEAARAGEQGRGFAVVASEVRALAGRSASAAKEIKSLISASVERVEEGAALVDMAGTTMNQVVEAIARLTQVVTEISAATAAQNLGIGQIGEAVSQMDRVTQQNAALVEEMAAAAASLKTQAQALVRTVAVFKTGSADLNFNRLNFEPLTLDRRAHNAGSTLALDS
jgi:methyl-accepting chemotaxis protein